MLDVYGAMLRLALAILAGTLPRRLSDPLGDRLPLSATALPSALLPMALALGLGLPAFLAYAQEITSFHVDLALELAERSPDVSTALPVGLSVFTLFSFALATPQGLFVTYLALSGFYRAVSVSLDEPRGDPVLTLIDRLACDGLRWARDARTTAARRRQEGEEVPDRLLRGDELDLPGADYLVVASRPKPGWEAGVIVITDEGFFRIGRPFDHRFPEGLRAIYPLTEKNDCEVIRRQVRYDLPTATTGP